MKNRPRHIEEDELIKSVIDEDDLADETREHLDSCHECGQARRRLERELMKLGEMAEMLTPSSRRRYQVPDVRAIEWKRPVFALGLVLILAMTFTGWMVYTGDWSRPENPRFTYEYTDQKPEMPDEFSDRNHVLPVDYQFMTGDKIHYFDEEFINFVVPEPKVRYTNG